MSPLSDAADEIILSIIQHLTPPLYLEPDLPKDISSLLNLSCTCTRLRRIVKPALFKRVVLFAPADKDGKLHAPAVPRIRSYCQLLVGMCNSLAHTARLTPRPTAAQQRFKIYSSSLDRCPRLTFTARKYALRLDRQGR